MMRRLAPMLSIPWIPPYQPDDPPLVNTTVGSMMELRWFVALISLKLLYI